jgi:hypothetical protein
VAIATWIRNQSPSYDPRSRSRGSRPINQITATRTAPMQTGNPSPAPGPEPPPPVPSWEDARKPGGPKRGPLRPIPLTIVLRDLSRRQLVQWS